MPRLFSPLSERVALCGGELRAGPIGRGFVVRARLPRGDLRIDETLLAVRSADAGGARHYASALASGERRINISADSIYTGALGAAHFARRGAAA